MLLFIFGAVVGFLIAVYLSCKLLMKCAEDGTLMAGKYRITLEDE